MRAVDANVLVRLVTRDDKKQVISAEAFVFDRNLSKLDGTERLA